MTSQEVTALRARLEAPGRLTLDESFAFAKICCRLLDNEATEDDGRDLVIRSLEYRQKFDRSTAPMWADLVAAAGLFPYMSEDVAGASALRREFHRSDSLESILLHREQLVLSEYLASGRSLVVSAPTSFGKSLLIEEVIARRIYHNIVVIQPTLALLDETRKRLTKYGDAYQIIVSTHQPAAADRRNLLLLTAERLVEYEHLPAIDFFVIDEFYKLSPDRDDERATTLNQALHRLLKHTQRFYLLGPNVHSVSEELLAKYSAVWHKSAFATVAVNVDKVYEGEGWKARGSDEERKSKLYALLKSLREPTIIYCAGPAKAMELAAEFAAHLSSADAAPALTPANSEVVDWVEENLHTEWCLVDTLPFAIGFHHGNVPRHLAAAMVDAFNGDDIRYLFCTSTLIEGVNTRARHVVLFDQRKGRKAIDYFDYKNIVGRSGRMRVHYLGYVHEFHKEPKEQDLNVDIPLFEQEKASLDLLVAIGDEEVKGEVRHRLAPFKELSPELQAIIKGNSGVPVEGQMAFVEELEGAIDDYYPAFRWTSVPKHRRLAVVLDLCWRHFLRSHESKGEVRSASQLATLALQYHEGESLRYVIAQNLPYWQQQLGDRHAAVQRAVHTVLAAARTWFEYRLPKWLAAASALQGYVFSRHGLVPGNYAFLSAALENSFIKGALSVLRDYDVPVSAMLKLQRRMGTIEDWATLVERMAGLDLSALGLLPYERKRIEAAIGRRNETTGG